VTMVVSEFKLCLEIRNVGDAVSRFFFTRDCGSRRKS
jgi:hypothetical protein